MPAAAGLTTTTWPLKWEIDGDAPPGKTVHDIVIAVNVSLPAEVTP